MFLEELKYTEILRENKALSAKIGGSPYRVSILSNVTVNSFKEILEYSLRVNGINPEITIGNYDNIVQDSAQSKDDNLVIIFFDTLNVVDSVSTFFESLDAGVLDELRKKLFAEIDIIFGNLRNVPAVMINTFSSRLFVSGYDQSTKLETFVNELNQCMESKKPGNTSLIEIDKIISRIGVNASFDRRLYKSSKAPYTLAFLKNYATAILPLIFRHTGKLKKALIFDCDNTLWKGIIGEDGANGIAMAAGTPYRSVQQIAAFLSTRGVIIGLCSKNNPEDVEEVLLRHPDMVLKNDQIVIKKVNWENKASNLKTIAGELNIGIDSLVFVDDSAFEIGLVQEVLPEVVCLQVPSNVMEYPEFILRQAHQYFNLDPNKEDLKKTEIYKQQFQRESERDRHESLDQYLASLNIQLTINMDNASQVARVAQLTQKTNQFNLTTRRYTVSQIQDFVMRGDANVFTLSVKDKFGDSGLTGVCIVKQNVENRKVAVIDSLLMSCRIIGRNIEFVFINHLLHWLRNNGYSEVTAEFIPTNKNAQVKDFYETLGFMAEGEGLNKLYSVNLREIQSRRLDYIAINADFTTIEN